jgi:hypothetical protein
MTTADKVSKILYLHSELTLWVASQEFITTRKVCNALLCNQPNSPFPYHSLLEWHSSRSDDHPIQFGRQHRASKHKYACYWNQNEITIFVLKLVVCILLRVLGQVQGFRLTQQWFEYFI